MLNVISYNLRIIRIIQKYFQLKIGRKIRIFSLSRKNNILMYEKECSAVIFTVKIDCGIPKSDSFQFGDNALQCELTLFII